MINDQTLQGTVGSIPSGNTASNQPQAHTYGEQKEKAFTGIENINITMDSYSNGAHASVEIRLSKAPSSVEDLAHTIASDYLKYRGINMTLDELIDEYLPEHTV